MSYKTAAIENLIRTGKNQISMQTNWLFVVFHTKLCMSKTGAGADLVFGFDFVTYHTASYGVRLQRIRSCEFTRLRYIQMRKRD